MPYSVARHLFSPKFAAIHRTILNPLLKRMGPAGPATISMEQARVLQGQFPRRDGYRYDREAKRARATGRADSLLEVTRGVSVHRCLEFGAGDGHVALELTGRGLHCDTADIVDWRDEEVRQSGVRHCEARDNTLSCDEAEYDLVFSYNTFEHVEDPEAALRELVRVVRPGGVIYLSFGPLFNAPFGLHAYRTVYFPYPQFLLDADNVEQFVAQFGIEDLGCRRNTFQYVNGWSMARFKELFSRADLGVSRSVVETIADYSAVGMIYRHLPCFVNRGVDFDELTTDSLVVTLTVDEHPA
ncbi:MAG TPA: class I SAM-dependent methyltransferase [Pirellulaceae bacterium]|nr:class I SAM-dependent methyltransferase [Pirellulaceae bacterium]